MWEVRYVAVICAIVMYVAWHVEFYPGYVALACVALLLVLAFKGQSFSNAPPKRKNYKTFDPD